jgi:5-methylthioadenosine/S-adenosylhomocysteine deaminase
VGVAAGVLLGTTNVGADTRTTSVEPVALKNEKPRHTGVLIKSGNVITCDDKLGVLREFDVRIVDDKIVEIGRGVRARHGDQIIDAHGDIVMPGLVDNHRHLWTRLFAGISVDHLFGPYFQLISQRAAQRLTPAHMRLACYVGGLESLNAGITTVLDWNHACYTRTHALAALTGLQMSGVRGVFGYAAPSTLYGPDVPPSDDDIDAVLKVINKTSTLSLAIPPRSPRQVVNVPGGLDRIRADIERARALGVPVTMHTGLDTDTDFRWLLDNDLVGPDSTYIHANMLTRWTFSEIADRGGSVSSSPEVEMQMFGLEAPLRAMIDSDVNITFSSDLPASQRADLLTQLKIGLQTQRMLDYQSSNGQTSILPTVSGLPWVTTNAAKSLGLESEIGSITVGKKADVIVINGTSPSTLGVANPVSAVLTYSTVADTHTVIANGRIVKRDGKLLVGDDLRYLHQGVLSAQRDLLSGL